MIVLVLIEEDEGVHPETLKGAIKEWLADWLIDGEEHDIHAYVANAD